ncbi:MAG TPA: LamG domain-containing protein [Candidatus Acidoferrales bacterium]|nr:LamG domain-containing protein [Candidatus Acidoferrales bacterium]
MYAVSEFIRGALADRLFLRLTPKTKKQPDANPVDAAINATGRGILLPILLLTFLLCSPHTAHAACASPAGAEGQIVYNGTYHVLQYCDNLNVWNAMGMTGPGAGGAGCSGPAGVEGQMMYNQTYHMLQWCDGTTWHAVTGLTTNSYDQGMAVWWKFDEASGTSPADSSGTGNTGTLLNDATGVWVPGEINNAAYFDTNHLVQHADTASLQLAGSWSVSLWFKATSLPGSGAKSGLLVKVGPVGDNYDVILDNGNISAGNGVMVYFNSTGCCDNHFVKSGAVSAGTWYHFVGVYDYAAQTLTAYLNGASIGSSSVAGFRPSTGPGGAFLSVGASNNSLNDPFNGTIDDVRVYSRALSAAEITALYNAGNGGLVGWWKMDEGTGTSAADSSGQGNTMTLDGSPLPSWTTSGKLNGALTFNGTTAGTDAGNPAALHLGVFTVSAWVNFSALPGAGKLATLASKWTFNGQPNYGVYLDNGNRSAGVGWVSWFGDAGSTNHYAKYLTTPSTGTWYLVTSTFDGTTLTLYVNGVSVASTVTGAVPYTDLSGGSGRNMGIGADNSANSDFAAATIDDVRVYNRVLSAAEVLALYNAGSGCTGVGLAGWWKLDDASSGTAQTTAVDSSGNGNTGTTNNAPTWVAGHIGPGALSLSSGSSQTLSVADAASLRMASSFTLSAWVNFTTLPTAGHDTSVIFKNAATGTNYDLNIDNADGNYGAGLGVVLNYNSSGCCDNNYVKYVPTPAITTGTWYHIAGVYDSVSQMQTVYLNGVAGATHSVAGLPPQYGAGNGVQMGLGDVYFDGTIDDARVYSRALSAGEILSLYNTGTDAVEGELMYNATSHVPQFCDGTSWKKAK